jgi:hypothetical protein
MIYSHKGYKIDNNKSFILLTLQLRDCYTEYKSNGKTENVMKLRSGLLDTLLHTKEKVNIAC